MPLAERVAENASQKTCACNVHIAETEKTSSLFSYAGERRSASMWSCFAERVVRGLFSLASLQSTVSPVYLGSLPRFLTIKLPPFQALNSASNMLKHRVDKHALLLIR